MSYFDGLEEERLRQQQNFRAAFDKLAADLEAATIRAADKHNSRVSDRKRLEVRGNPRIATHVEIENNETKLKTRANLTSEGLEIVQPDGVTWKQSVILTGSRLSFANATVDAVAESLIAPLAKMLEKQG